MGFDCVDLDIGTMRAPNTKHNVASSFGNTDRKQTVGACRTVTVGQCTATCYSHEYAPLLSMSYTMRIHIILFDQTSTCLTIHSSTQAWVPQSMFPRVRDCALFGVFDGHGLARAHTLTHAIAGPRYWHNLASLCATNADTYTY